MNAVFIYFWLLRWLNCQKRGVFSIVHIMKLSERIGKVFCCLLLHHIFGMNWDERTAGYIGNLTMFGYCCHQGNNKTTLKDTCVIITRDCTRGHMSPASITFPSWSIFWHWLGMQLCLIAVVLANISQNIPFFSVHWNILKKYIFLVCAKFVYLWTKG